MAQMPRRAEHGGLPERYRAVRALTESLCDPFEVEDLVVQPIDDVSPAKWHLGHTTWFFEQFILARHEKGFRPHDPRAAGVFNSYYQSVGRPYPRARRGTLSRPTVREVLAYRAAVDERMLVLLDRLPAAAAEAVELGLQHEQQHQELLVADLEFVLAHNGVAPRRAPAKKRAKARPMRFVGVAGGDFRLGHDGRGFSFDNERPAHRTYTGDFRLADRPVTNAEYAQFVRDGGYRDFRLWLSDGWDRVRLEGWAAPLHWELARGEDDAPVCHLSYYEADAFARWAGKRLPTEAEWERAAAGARPEDGRFLEDSGGRPLPDPGGRGLRQLFGDVWEWTSSAYGPYPGFRPLPGAFGEYNGKFMSGQLVLRGGSCATPRGHVRRSYRNFFQPEKRWQFTGLRLAEDAR